jgi:DNA-binding MarR family transcriptional regulator
MPEVTRAAHEDEWFRLTDDERAAWYGFLRAHAEVTRALGAELEAAHGLPFSAYDVLLQLSLAPNRQLSMSDLAEAVLLSPSGVSRLVERLEREGLVERRPGDTDSRVVRATITGRGLDMLAVATPTHLNGVRERFLGGLSPTQVKQLAAIWRRVMRPRRPGTGSR